MDDFYGLSVAEALGQLESSPSGLTGEEANRRLREYGRNELETKKRASAIIVFLKQFMSPLIYVLAIAAIISFLVGHYTDAFVILGILVLNAAIGYFQETQAEKSMQALLELASPKAKVKRDNDIKVEPAGELVPGDIIHLEAGDKIPADARLVEASNLKVNESTLTGESMPEEKDTRKMPEIRRSLTA
jgi:Ca2+-transporting ATPase